MVYGLLALKSGKAMGHYANENEGLAAIGQLNRDQPDSRGAFALVGFIHGRPTTSLEGPELDARLAALEA